MTPTHGKSTRRPPRPSTPSYEPRRLTIEPNRWNPPPSLADVEIHRNDPGRGRRLRAAYFRAKGIDPQCRARKRVSVLEAALRSGVFDQHLQRMDTNLRQHGYHPFRCWRGRRQVGF